MNYKINDVVNLQHTHSSLLWNNGFKVVTHKDGSDTLMLAELNLKTMEVVKGCDTTITGTDCITPTKLVYKP